MIDFSSHAIIERDFTFARTFVVRCRAHSGGYGALACCDTREEAEALKAACDELPARTARALSLSGRTTPDPTAVIDAAKEVRAAYDAMTCAITVSADDEGERFLRALATLRIALAAGAHP